MRSSGTSKRLLESPLRGIAVKRMMMKSENDNKPGMSAAPERRPFMRSVKKGLFYSFRMLYSFNRWLRRRFTPAGFFVLCAALAAAVVGVDTRRSMAYQAFMYLSSVLVLSMAWSVIFRARFAVERILPRFGTAGEELVYRIKIRNLTGRKQAGLSFFEDIEDPRPSFREFLQTPEPNEARRNVFDRAMGYYRWSWLLSQRTYVRVRENDLPVLPPKGDADTQARLLPKKRGRLALEGVTVACPDPFGLFKSFVNVRKRQSVLILPKRYRLPDIRLPGSRKYQSGGVALAGSVGDSEEFLSLRDYRPGDPLKKIHWRSWAKTGRPVVKEYQDEFFVRHALVLDTFQKEAHTKAFEEAVSVASSFAYAVQTQETLLDLIFVGPEAYCFTSGRGVSRIERTLEILASVAPCRDKPFDALPPSVFQRAGLLSGCICVLLSWDRKRKAFVDRLEAMGVPALTLVIAGADSAGSAASNQETLRNENVHILDAGKIEEGLARL